MQDTIYGITVLIRMIQEYPLPTIIFILCVMGCWFKAPVAWIKDDKGNTWELFRWLFK